jgi:hypothetical protein
MDDKRVYGDQPELIYICLLRKCEADLSDRSCVSDEPTQVDRNEADKLGRGARLTACVTVVVEHRVRVDKRQAHWHHEHSQLFQRELELMSSDNTTE